MPLNGRAKECRKLADEAKQMAESSPTEKLKAQWLRVSAEWLKLAQYLDGSQKPASVNGRHNSN